MGAQSDEVDHIDMDEPSLWTPRYSATFEGRTQREAYDWLIDGLDASDWAFKKSERGNRLRPESYIRETVLPIFDEYSALYQPDSWDSFPANTHQELIEWRKRESMMAYRWEQAKAKCKKRGSWLVFGWLVVLVLLVTSINEIFSAARERERAIEWGQRISERMKADNHAELADQLNEYMVTRW